MTPFLHGFADELVKLGAMQLAHREASGAQSVAPRAQPQGYGGGQTAYKPPGKQQMNFSTTKQKKPDYVPVGTQKFKPQAVKAVAAPVKKRGRRRRGKTPVDGPKYETAPKMSKRLDTEQASKRRVSAQADEKWYSSKNSANLKPGEQKRYDRIKGMGLKARQSAAAAPKKVDARAAREEAARAHNASLSKGQRARSAKAHNLKASRGQLPSQQNDDPYDNFMM